MIQLKIDDFIFQGFEIPENIAFGGQQLLAVHKLVGGTRVIDSMGRDDDPLEWSGLFQGSDALTRAKYLHALRVEGKSHTLTWDSLSYVVIIRSFHADYKRGYLIPYRIICEIVKDNANLSTATPLSDITKAIKDDVEAVEGAGKEVYVHLVEDIEPKVVKMVSLVGQVKDFINATNAQITAIKNAIADVQQAIQDEITAVTNQIQALTTLGGLIPGNPVSASALKLGNSVTAANTAYKLENIRFTLQRAQKNLTATTSTPNADTTQVSGTTLYQVALDWYGDATLWDVIAAANGLTDPIITGIQTLTIPPRPRAS